MKTDDGEQTQGTTREGQAASSRVNEQSEQITPLRSPSEDATLEWNYADADSGNYAPRSDYVWRFRRLALGLGAATVLITLVLNYVIYRATDSAAERYLYRIDISRPARVDYSHLTKPEESEGNYKEALIAIVDMQLRSGAWSGARIAVEKLLELVLEGDPQPSDAHPPAENAALTNSLILLEALLEQTPPEEEVSNYSRLARMFFIEDDVSLDKVQRFLRESQTADLQSWLAYANAMLLLRDGAFEAARAELAHVLRDPVAGNHFRDLALLGMARAHYWEENLRIRSGAASKQSVSTTLRALAKLREQLARPTFKTDVQFYLVDLSDSFAPRQRARRK